MTPANLSNEELIKLPAVRNDLSELELELISRLTAAIDEVDSLANQIEEVDANGADT